MINKILFLLFFFIFLISGCGRWVNTIPPGKTVEQNWEQDEMYCREKSGKITGVLGVSVIGVVNNTSIVNDNYNKCLEELGWMKYKRWIE